MQNISTKRFFPAILSAVLSSACNTPPPCDDIPAALPGANSGCLLTKDDTILAIQHHNNRWSLPGGTNESGESAQCTAQRETWEETGLDVEVGELVLVFDNNFHLFSCQATVTATLKIQDAGEVKHVQWLPINKLENYPWRFPKQTRDLIALLKKNR